MDEDDAPCSPSSDDAASLTDLYRTNPTIENYISLRRQCPNKDFEIATLGGMEWLLAFHKELEACGIDPEVMAGALDGDLDAQSKISLLLIELILKRKQIERRGEKHAKSRGLVIRDVLINRIICEIIVSGSFYDDFKLSKDLTMLIKNQLIDELSEIDADLKKRERRFNAIFIAAQLLDLGEKLSYRKIASIMEVEPSTVMRWFPENDLIERAEKLIPSVRRMKAWQQSDTDEGCAND